jgi:hypothetical protein
MWLRGGLVAFILGLWLAVGIAWGQGAALVFAFFLFLACVLVTGGAIAGSLVRRAGGGYYDRQLNGRAGGRSHKR